MIHKKTVQEIEIMRDGGKRLGNVLAQLLAFAQPGISLVEIDKKAGELIAGYSAVPSFTTVKGYKWPTCLCVNENVVHCIPTKRILEDGDILTIDVGLIYKGFHTDTAWTKIVGTDTSAEKESKEKFLQVGQLALSEAIKLATIGTHIGTMSASTQKIIESAGYSIIKSLVGHGVGKELHEDPQVPNYVRGDYRNTYQFRGGETVAIEPIYVMGKPNVVYEKNDGWTIATRDRSLAAVFEHSIALTQNGPLILTAQE
jgi:methionyl aminopeptidase